MSAYRLTSDPKVVQRAADGAFVPEDARNPDWRDYQAWRAAGHAPDPAPEPEGEDPPI